MRRDRSQLLQELALVALVLGRVPAAAELRARTLPLFRVLASEATYRRQFGAWKKLLPQVRAAAAELQISQLEAARKLGFDSLSAATGVDTSSTRLRQSLHEVFPALNERQQKLLVALIKDAPPPPQPGDLRPAKKLPLPEFDWNAHDLPLAFQQLYTRKQIEAGALEAQLEPGEQLPAYVEARKIEHFALGAITILRRFEKREAKQTAQLKHIQQLQQEIASLKRQEKGPPPRAEKSPPVHKTTLQSRELLELVRERDEARQQVRRLQIRFSETVSPVNDNTLAQKLEKPRQRDKWYLLAHFRRRLGERFSISISPGEAFDISEELSKKPVLGYTVKGTPVRFLELQGKLIFVVFTPDTSGQPTATTVYTESMWKSNNPFAF